MGTNIDPISNPTPAVKDVVEVNQIVPGILAHTITVSISFEVIPARENVAADELRSRANRDVAHGGRYYGNS
jgi:hypothetical protein